MAHANDTKMVSAERIKRNSFNSLCMRLCIVYSRVRLFFLSVLFCFIPALCIIQGLTDSHNSPNPKTKAANARGEKPPPNHISVYRRRRKKIYYYHFFPLVCVCAKITKKIYNKTQTFALIHRHTRRTQEKKDTHEIFSLIFIIQSV